eukprot:1536679-Pyramimonas_sp.AAC.2
MELALSSVLNNCRSTVQLTMTNIILVAKTYRRLSQAAKCEATGNRPDVIDNPFVYPELTAGLKQRARAQNMLVDYMTRAQDEVRQIHERLAAGGGVSNLAARLRFAKDIDALEKKVNSDTQVGLSHPKARGQLASPVPFVTPSPTVSNPVYSTRRDNAVGSSCLRLFASERFTPRHGGMYAHMCACVNMRVCEFLNV